MVVKTPKMLYLENKIGQKLEDFLNEEYLENRKTTREIAKILEVSQWSIEKWLIKTNIPLRKGIEALSRGTKSRPSNDDLRRWYLEDKKSANEIGKIIGVSETAVLSWLKELKITRSNREARFIYLGKNIKIPSNEQLYNWYVRSKISARKIAQKLGCSVGTITNWLKREDVKLRSPMENASLQYGKKIQKPSNEQLNRWYIDQKKSSYEIANIIGVTDSTVRKWLNKVNIPLRKDYYEMHGYNFKKPSTEQLQKWYVRERKSTSEIAKMVGVDGSAVLNWLKETGILRRRPREASFARYDKVIERPLDEQLYNWYIIQKKSSKEIAKILGVADTTAIQWLREECIKRRTPREAESVRQRKEIIKPTNEQLCNWYIKEGKSTSDIAKLTDVDKQTAWRWLREEKILIRDTSEANFARMGKVVIKPSNAQLKKWYLDEKKTTLEIGEIIGINCRTVNRWLRETNIPIRKVKYGYKTWILCKDGHKVRSSYEREVDNWLFLNGINHEYNGLLPKSKKFRYDFKVNNQYIEIWGLKGINLYDKKASFKILHYEKFGLNRTDIFPEDFGTGGYILKLRQLLSVT